MLHEEILYNESSKSDYENIKLIIAEYAHNCNQTENSVYLYEKENSAQP
jgi:hypothetical protein